MKRALLLTLLFSACSRGGESEALLEVPLSSSQEASQEVAILTIAQTNSITKDDRKRLYRSYPTTLEKIDENQPLSLQDIKNLTRAGVADPAIIHQIAASRSYFFLTSEDIEELRQAGVSEKVIAEMDLTGQAIY